ncbi:Tah1p KNAG_0I02520 [Huiozyma naganishii CBS 8797]|uniref:Uncharacterized protein n=1 Tax=Huiozyma naganishii (strain ATCC MYA-139 / BCRC 22969 / CBS 8797 / KCTC 17520 / NBRC 10181 / NCYC 3082 / Yp74L-3) TaxID=1071383 RepID=J7S2I3_HUIN7|nr:hypothetical protein KNAG_0I02520 [Kazachstania naganishii CBS 8797]CCK72037.1 hypothetical protein KNAG_0I02520 [Kazachstania naganishii CBS 8797]
MDTFETVKEQGNVAFRNSNFSSAAEYYGKCICLEPENPIGYSNRAMALIKLQKFSETIDTCQRGLGKLEDNEKDEPIRKKLLYRLHLAQESLNKFQVKTERLPVEVVDHLPPQFAQL